MKRMVLGMGISPLIDRRTGGGGHAWIGLAAALVLPAWVVLLAYAAWEAVQWRRYGANAWDCLLDWCAVALGVSVAVALSLGHDAVAAAIGTVLAAGIGMWVRR